jgi:nucleoside 2-deoxyribosyltransferase
LASPYSKYPKGLEAAFQEISRVGGYLLGQGIELYCPIAHNHPMHMYSPIDLPNTHEFWLGLDTHFLADCDALVICTMETWDTSSGIDTELKYALHHDIPVYYLDPDTLELK